MYYSGKIGCIFVPVIFTTRFFIKINMTIPKLAIAERTDFSPESRLWVYTANRALTPSETSIVQATLDQFCQQWTAHDQALKAVAEVFQQRFVLLMVDETQAGASGCSIDKSVHFLERLGAELGVDFFERMQFGWVDANGQIQVCHRAEFSKFVQENVITVDTPVLNTLVSTRKDMERAWYLPFGESWHRKLV